MFLQSFCLFLLICFNVKIRLRLAVNIWFLASTFTSASEQHIIPKYFCKLMAYKHKHLDNSAILVHICCNAYRKIAASCRHLQILFALISCKHICFAPDVLLISVKFAANMCVCCKHVCLQITLINWHHDIAEIFSLSL